MRQSESIAKLAYALTRAQKELPLIKRETVNPFYKSKYADLPTIFDAIRPVLAAHGLAVLQGGDGENGTRLGVSTMLLHESGEFIEYTFPMPCSMADPQKAGSAITYGRRYGLQSILGIAAEEDDDGNAAAKGSQASQEGHSSPATGDDPICGLCGAPGVVRDSSKGKFWGCSKYGETKCKGKFPKYVDPADQSILDNEPSEDSADHPDPRAVTVMDILRGKGKETAGQQMAALARATQAAKLDLPRGSNPEKWLSGLTDEDLGKIVDALDAQVTE